jgi:hypothetical protein
LHREHAHPYVYFLELFLGSDDNIDAARRCFFLAAQEPGRGRASSAAHAAAPGIRIVFFPRRYSGCAGLMIALACAPTAHAATTTAIGVRFTIDSVCRINKTPLQATQDAPGVNCLHDEPVAVAKGTTATGFTQEALDDNASQPTESASESGKAIWIVSF